MVQNKTKIDIIRLLFVVLCFLSIFGCSKKVIVTPPVIPTPPGPDQLFNRAETAFQKQEFGLALQQYQHFVSSYKDNARVPYSLYQIAKIQNSMGKYQESQSTLERIIREYPNRLESEQSILLLLKMNFSLKKYDEMLVKAASFYDTVQSSSTRTQIQILKGDAHFALGNFFDAFVLYQLAFEKALNQDKSQVINTIQTNASQLNPDQLKHLIENRNPQLPIAYLQFELAKQWIATHQYMDAQSVLSALINEYPKHVLMGQAKEMFLKIPAVSDCDRNTIGCLLPLNGKYKHFGSKALRAIQLALSDYSTDPNKPKIKLIIRDTGENPEKISQFIQEFDKLGVAIIIGPLSGAEEALSQAQEKKIPIIALSQKAGLTNIGDYVFRHFLTPQAQVKIIVSHAVKNLNAKRFAILCPDDVYGKTYVNLFWNEVSANGGKIVGIESYPADQTDFSIMIKKLIGSHYEVPQDIQQEIDPNSQTYKPGQVDFDALFIPDGANKVGMIAPQLTYYDINGVQLLGTNLWHSNDLIRTAKPYVQGATLPEGFFAESLQPTVSEFVKHYSEIYAENPQYIEAVAYDTTRIVFQLLDTIPASSRSAIRDGLLQFHGYQGLTGFSSFDENREAINTLYLLQVNGDQFIEIPSPK
ncbi:MAG: penicillin-binding protein activator [Desulfobacterales bacterium]|nr:penicillin-binding protein activator [Desulfobacterales bacterium]